MRTHPAVTVAHGELAAEVDVELAPLIGAAWEAGMVTIHSCQDVGENVAGLAEHLPHLDELVRRETGRASIGFASAGGLVAFCETVANAGPRDGLYERMVHWATPDAWQLVVALQDRGLVEEELPAAVDGTPLTRFETASFQVRFPRSDIAEVTERLRRHNRGDRVALGRPDWTAITVPEES